MECIPDEFDVEGILSYEVLTIGLDFGPYGQLLLLQAGLADAAYARIGVNPDKRPMESLDELDVSDFHTSIFQRICERSM